MKIVIAPQSFKGSLAAPDVAEAIARGVRKIFPKADLLLLPVADGGEGTVTALVGSCGGEIVTTRVMGPLERPVDAEWGLIDGGRTAVIEMAAASGLPLINREERNPLLATTFGTGELIWAALERGVRKLIIGLGGSATNDAGAGMASALGVRFLDQHGRELPLGGAALARLDRIDVSGVDPRLAGVEVEAACDVTNPLTGPEGASAIYGPQKGASVEMVEELDAALFHYSEMVRRDLGLEIRDVPGAGAAGGLGAGLIAFLGARLRPGVDIVFDAIGLDAKLDGASLVITGEGRMDSQDIYGKAPMAVAERAHARGIPTLAVVGSTARDYRVVYGHGMDAVIGTITRPMTIDRAVRESSHLIAEAGMRAARLIRIGMTIERKKGP